MVIICFFELKPWNELLTCKSVRTPYFVCLKHDGSVECSHTNPWVQVWQTQAWLNIGGSEKKLFTYDIPVRKATAS